MGNQYEICFQAVDISSKINIALKSYRANRWEFCFFKNFYFTALSFGNICRLYKKGCITMFLKNFDGEYGAKNSPINENRIQMSIILLYKYVLTNGR